MSLGGVLWGTLLVAVGFPQAASIPFGYVAITAVNLAVLSRSCDLWRCRTLQVLASLLLPFALQWWLGGFVKSGGVMLWSLIALAGSLPLTSNRQSRFWLLFYVALTVGSGVFDRALAARTAFRPSPGLVVGLFVINISVISSIVFTLGMAITQRQRRAIEALEAGQEANRGLTEKLTEAVASRERDIERLRAAEAALTDLASGLETQVRARTGELEQALVRAEAGTRAKGSFLAMMSHEIRTPLNGILATAELLQLTALDAEQAEGVTLIRRSGDLLLTVINDVLDFSKVEAGRMELAPRAFRLRAELGGVVALHRANAQRNGVRLEVEVAEPVPDVVVADADRLLQVIGNLLGNAVKFTHAGAITLSVRAAFEGDGARLHFAVRDTGVGISAEAIGRLFQPFSQADSTTTRRYGGTGLGLAICARLVALMGGRIGVTSEPGAGTTFSFDVRAGLGDATSLRRASGGPRGHAPDGVRVLLAEDNPVNQTIATRLLRRLGCEVEVAPDGGAAVAMAGAADYDLVLMDMQMPVADGLTATRAIRALPLARQPRIIALTANAYASDRDACLAAGMNGFLAKPMSLDRLREEIQSLRAENDGDAARPSRVAGG
ncbi:MAG: ATP-binding protein [Polyangiales bacterium]